MNYADIYTHDFFLEADGFGEWERRKLKYGDALAAIAYAFGIPSFEAFRRVTPFPDLGRYVYDGVDAKEQLRRVAEAGTRSPRAILEIGPGRGEVATSFAYFGHSVQVIEPSSGVEKWLDRTARRFFDLGLDDLPIRVHRGAAHEVVGDVDWSVIDTVIMVESLEHILPEHFEPVRERIVEALCRNRGRFIITNWLDFHPIAVGQFADAHLHCRRVDDALYDEWAKDATSVVFRSGSHLVLDYMPRDVVAVASPQRG